MKKIVTATDLGGAPFFKNDMREVFNSEIWDAIEALLSPYDSDVEGIIVSGCEISANAANFDITAGIVYLNGEFMRLPAATNQSFTKYIAPATASSDSRTFADSTTHAVVETKTAELVGAAPGAGQYVTINSLTGANDRVWRPATADQSTRIKIIEIGDWDMDAVNSIAVAHGMGADFSKIRSVTGIIRNDANDRYYVIGTDELFFGPGFGVVPASTGIDSTDISIVRAIGSLTFDSANFDSTSYNRGWLTIMYVG